MTIPFCVFLLLPVTTFYLGSRAVITTFLWSRYPAWLATLRDCAACSSFWDALLLAWLFTALDVPLPFANIDFGTIFLALMTVTTTPMIAFLHQEALFRLGSSSDSISSDSISSSEETPSNANPEDTIPTVDIINH